MLVTDRQWLLELADLLESEESDRLELSQEFARMIAERLRAIAEGRAGEWVRSVPRAEYNLDGEWRESDGQADEIQSG